MKNKTGSQRQAEFKSNMRALGYKQVAVWVHSTQLEKFNKYVLRLRHMAELKE